MVWHILKKDLRLLWIFAVSVGALQFASAAVRLWLDVAPTLIQLGDIAPVLTVMTIVGMVVLTVSVMHQDAVPGVSQDWLVRPVRRRDLILAKFLFVLLIVQGPALLADLGAGLAHGFGFGGSLEAALARNAALLCLITLPAVMVGSVTRSVTESLIVALAGLVGYLVIFAIGTLMLLRARTTLGGTGLVWITPATWYALAIVGAPVVVAIQYLRRRTTAVRGLVFGGGALVILSAFMPWRLALAIQQRLAPEPGAASRIAVAFDPALGKFQMPPGAAAGTRRVLYLPLRVTGIPSSAAVVLDRAEIHIHDTGGALVYEGRTNLSVDGFGSIQDAQFEARQRREGEIAVAVYQRIFLPGSVLDTLASRAVDVDIDYTLTLFKPQAAYSLPAVDGHGALGELGSCSTRIDSEGDDVQLRCMSTRTAPSCFTAYLENMVAGVRNPEVHVCDPNYSPFDGRFWPDSLTRSGGELPFFDRSGLTHYPIDGSKLPGSRFVVETYAPRDHFVRRIRIPEAQLANFLGAAGAAQAP
jgi:hypothetical protein